MALLEMESSNLRPEYHVPHCTYSCWLPILMGFLSLSVGICCLFFMSRIGIVLCVLNSIFGLIFSYITYSTLARPKRYKAIVAIAGNLLHICLLLGTVVYGSRLLVINVQAEAKNNAANASPVFNFMLDYYLAYGGYESSPSGDEGEEPKSLPSPSSSSSRQIPDGEMALGNQTLPSSLDWSVPAAAPTAVEKGAFPPLPILPDDFLNLNRPQPTDDTQLRDLLSRQAARFKAVISAVRATAKDTSWVNFNTRDSWVSSSTDSSGEETEEAASNPMDSCDHGKEEPVCCPCLFSRDDLNCIAKAATSDAFAESVLKRLRSLLYWGLFCGYVEWGLAFVTKLNRKCAEDCLLDQFDFSRQEGKQFDINAHAVRLMKHIKAVPQKQARLCASKAAVASCRVEETLIQRGAAAALCAALPLSVVLIMFCLTCIVACWKIAQRYNAKVQNR
ncbi:hypothetical protein EBH_0013150 [Eimeria brunetti]|uniref:Transmembrane protein n=1 Tax=Eimeria brunetti TaxID=51314 RepID=U6LDN0_9EIME|nr:hypothetical protein EBH_0013150 [Eimeria brunetti]